MSNNYVTIKLPRDMTNEIDKLIGKHGYTSRADVTKDAIRRLLQNCKETP